MREQNMIAQDLRAKLGMSERTIQTLLTPYRFSHISQIERALKAVGRSLIVEDMDTTLAKPSRHPGVKERDAVPAA